MRDTDIFDDKNQTDEYEVDVHACSSMDCTGLIPALPQSEAELESYEDLYPYVTLAVKKEED